MEEENKIIENNIIESEVIESEITMNDVIGEIEDSMKKVSRGDIVKGKVIEILDKEVVVSIGHLADGIISMDEMSSESFENLNEIIKVGDEINVMVIKTDDGEGNLVLSKKRADQIVVWDELQQIHDKEEIIIVKPSEVVKGGVVANYKGIRAFIPASQLSMHYVEDLNTFIGVPLDVKLIEYDKEKKKIIFSRKIIEAKEAEIKKQEILSTIKKGQKYKGIVRRLVNFGAFVDMGGIDGLVHINELSWSNVKHPSEVVNVNDVVEVYVINFDLEKGKIALGLKDVNDSPWTNIKDKYREGQIVEGKVMKLMTFGAFVKIETGLEGLVHISQISEERIQKPEDKLTVGDNLKVKILSIDEKGKKLSLSVKEALAEGERIEIPDEYKEENKEMSSLGDLLKGKLEGLKFD